MKLTSSLFLFLALGLFASSSVMAQKASADDLVGNWKIDLRPTPDAEAYFQTFSVESVTDGVLKGSFYGSSLEKPFINNYWEKLHFAFTTSDQSNEYYHSGYLLNGKLYGTTYCPNRSFMAPWTGEKE